MLLYYIYTKKQKIFFLSFFSPSEFEYLKAEVSWFAPYPYEKKKKVGS